MLEQDADVSVTATSGPDDLVAALARHRDVDRIVLLGGDGSLHALVQALYDGARTGLAVALVPAGTGNDFARTLDIPQDHIDAARIAVKGEVQELDLAVTGDGSVVVNAAHIGVGADAAAAGAPLKRFLGPLGYAAGAVIAGFSRRGVMLEVRVDGEVVSTGEPVLQVAAGIGRFVGGGTELLPKADPSDGLLDIAISTATSPLRRLSYAWQLRKGVHRHRHDVRYVQGREVTVRGAATRATTDGELGEPSEEHSWHLLAGAWRFVAPASDHK